MLKMTDYKEIVSLRNKGYSQIEIAKMLSISRKTIGNYLREGEIPVYTRKRRTKKDPFEGYEQRVKELLLESAKFSSYSLVFLSRLILVLECSKASSIQVSVSSLNFL